MPQHRVAIVGLGMAVGPHAESLLDLRERVEVAYAFSPSAERRRSFAERFPFPLVDNLDAILADASVDAVILLTPPNTHLDLVRRAVDAGKHVLLEKPLEITTGRSEELVAACRAGGRKLGVVLQHRFRPAGIRLRELVEAGALGALLSVSTAMNLWRPQTYYDAPGRGTKARDGGGVLLTQGIHTLDLMLSIAGEPSEVMAYATTTPVHDMETEDLVTAAIRFEDGALGTIFATTAACPGYPERIEIAAEKGTATVAGTSLAVAWSDGRTETVEPDPDAGGTGADPMAFPPDYHRALIADFLDALEEDREPAINGEEALKVHRLIDALLASGASGAPARVAKG